MVWYFIIIVYSFGGASPPQQIGPFNSKAACDEIRQQMYAGPFGPKLSECWEAMR